MRIDIISVLPTMMEGFFQESILARAQKKGLVDIQLHNLRDYSTDKWRRVDDYPYGGSAGMVMQCEPIDRCISALQAQRHYDEVIYMSPDGETFNQHIANELSLKGNLIIPGSISDEQSALSDCFQDDLLAAPIYTRPADYKGWRVPEILLSGNEAKIRQWEFEQAMERTKRLRPDLLK